MQKCNLWPHTDKTGGFQRGAMPPLWHTTLLARCSVLYLLARLTVETGCDAVCTPLTLAGKRAGDLWADGSKTPVRFRRAAAGIQTSVPRPSSSAGGIKCPKEMVAVSMRLKNLYKANCMVDLGAYDSALTTASFNWVFNKLIFLFGYYKRKNINLQSRVILKEVCSRLNIFLQIKQRH